MSARYVMSLNNYLQGVGGNLASMLSWEEVSSGPPHALMWTVVCKIRGEPYGSAYASRKMAAKEEAARQALLRLGVPV
ncbi:hypothetical protein BJ322DRAFT_1106871 [Thelephora terrestris]|uniref:DRBM domain-containing protein n=1 Tax=Thelephora terrestris TaxID=56493 RepID=A0A9P6HGP7_9AGAM|nr:hypothetical protein BJ322DRAFT_1106871 [Thelephora terrestris]